VGEGVVEVGAVGGPAAGRRHAVPVAHPDPAVELGAGATACQVVRARVGVGRRGDTGGEVELGEPVLEFGEQRRPVAVVVRVECGEQRRRNLEFDDRGGSPPRPASGRDAGVGWSAAGEQDVLEVPVRIGEDDAPFGVASPRDHGEGVVGEHGAVARDVSGVLVEA
jgi:hypothetical protein